MTVQEYAARAIEKGAADLIEAARKVSEDKRDWQPLNRGRTVTDQMAECAALSGGAAELIAARAWQDRLVEENQWMRAALDTTEKAAAALRENTDKLAAVIRATPDAHLTTEITLPWLADPITLADFFLLMLWNMAYHEGQINYIRLLEAPAPQ